MNTDNLLKKAIFFHKNGNFEEARILFNKILKINPNDFEAVHSLGTIAAQNQDYMLASELLTHAISLNPLIASSYCNLGNVYRELKQFDKAFQCFDKALEIDSSNHVIQMSKGNCYFSCDMFEQALIHYNHAIKINPFNATLHYLTGVSFNRVNKLNEAINSLNSAITYNESYHEAYFQLGLIALKQNDPLKAVANFTMAITIKPDYSEAYHNSGLALFELKELEAANISYLKALELNPSLDYLLGTCLHNKMHICDWSNLEAGLDLYRNEIKNKNISLPFVALSLIDDESLHFNVAKNYMQHKYPKNNSIEFDKIRVNNNKIKIGYYSADYCNHATTHLMLKLFELHDRNSFEIYGFSFGNKILDEMHYKVINNFDKFFDVDSFSDNEIVSLSRDLNIDIAVDLKGYTKDNRTEIFAKRCAPIQVNYLGYPGTMGADYIDYIIADSVVIPESSKKYYSEKIIYLPNSYQVNDDSRVISNHAFSKEELNLPTEGFIYCCFNNNYKITPKVFSAWSEILRSVNGSVLWLLGDTAIAEKNLRQSAINEGLDPNRIIFANRISPELHLSRHKLADLFLDTCPYNAHTTASDSLWAGLPLLTKFGNSFASRVAASLLKSVGLPELITYSDSEYIEKAIYLATNKEELLKLKNKLFLNRDNFPLFKTSLFCNNLEKAYKEIHKRRSNNNNPDDIYV